jgi:hypothetical protein
METREGSNLDLSMETEDMDMRIDAYESRCQDLSMKYLHV